jgi:hypothetical protein
LERLGAVPSRAAIGVFAHDIFLLFFGVQKQREFLPHLAAANPGLATTFGTAVVKKSPTFCPGGAQQLAARQSF